MLSHEQVDELTVGFGFLAGRPSAFDSDDAAAEAWRLHGERIMEEWDTALERPRGWWMFARGVESGLGSLVSLVSSGALTDAEIRALPDNVRGWEAREILEHADLEPLPLSTRRALAAHEGLLSQLTPKGVAHFLEGLSGTMYAAVVELQEIDLASLPKVVAE